MWTYSGVNTFGKGRKEALAAHPTVKPLALVADALLRQEALERLPRCDRISWYREVFPATRIGRFKDSESEIEFTARGFRLATSVGGTLTGRGGEIIVIDDPLKPDDALSETKRTASNRWFTNTLLSRLDDKLTGSIVVLMQRVHVDDLTGFLLAEDQEILAQYLQQRQGRELASSGKSGPPAVNSKPEQRGDDDDAPV